MQSSGKHGKHLLLAVAIFLTGGLAYVVFFNSPEKSESSKSDDLAERPMIRAAGAPLAEEGNDAEFKRMSAMLPPQQGELNWKGEKAKRFSDVVQRMARDQNLDLIAIKPISTEDKIDIPHIRANGNAEGVLRFAGLFEEEGGLHGLRSIHLEPEKDDPSRLIFELERNDFEMVRPDPDKENSPPSPMELFQEISRVLPPRGVRLTGITLDNGQKEGIEGRSRQRITIDGESENLALANNTGVAIMTSDELDHFEWKWLRRPSIDTRRTDRTATFRIQGE